MLRYNSITDFVWGSIEIYIYYFSGLAALLHHKIVVRKDEKVCVIICGGNIDMSTLKQVYEYGLRALGR